jgi:hypothetical protein
LYPAMEPETPSRICMLLKIFIPVNYTANPAQHPIFPMLHINSRGTS